MTNSVNKVPLSSVEETTSGKSKEIDEFDVVDNFDSNYILEGAEELEQIEFNILANKISHPENLDIESQIKEIKSLSKKDVSENSFSINGKRGFISVENISIPEEGNVSNLREVTVSGKFLPWPKHFPNILPINYIFLSEKTSYRHFLNAIPSVLVGVDGEVYFSSLFSSKIDIFRGMQVNSFYTIINEGSISAIFNQQGNIDSLLTFSVSNYNEGTYGTGRFSGDYPILNLIISLNSLSVYSLNKLGNISFLSIINSELILNCNFQGNISILDDVPSTLSGFLSSNCLVSGDIVVGGYGTNEYSTNYGDPDTTEYSNDEYSDGFYGM